MTLEVKGNDNYFIITFIRKIVIVKALTVIVRVTCMDRVYLPRIFDMFELCMSGQAFKIFLRSSLAHTMNAFIGRLICGLFSPSLFCCLTILAEEKEKERRGVRCHIVVEIHDTLVRNESDFARASLGALKTRA